MSAFEAEAGAGNTVTCNSTVPIKDTHGDESDRQMKLLGAWTLTPMLRTTLPRSGG